MPSRSLRTAVSAALSLIVVAGGLVAAASAAAADPDLAAQGTISASAEQTDEGGYPAPNAIDRNDSTRWASGNGPDSDTTFTASITSDLGSIATVSGVSLLWEASYATEYEVQVATTAPDSASSWTTVTSVTDSNGARDATTFAAPVEARYVRIAMLKRAAALWEAPTLHYYGYSLFSFEVNGTFATPVAGFASAQSTVDAGSDAVVTVSLTNASESEQKVHVESVNDSAIAGTDYTAVDETVTFAPGATAASVTIATVSRGPLAPSSKFSLALSDPSTGIVLGARATTTITLRPSGTLPNAGETTVLEDFEDGVPSGYTTWASQDVVKPALGTSADAAIPGSADDNAVLTATVAGTPTGSDWFGFTNDTPAANWSNADGFSFWFLGKNSGKTLGFELKNGNQMFDRNVVDNSAGWREISVLFTDLRLKGNPSSNVRFDASVSTGFAVTLTGLGAGTHSFDDFAIFERATMLEDFEGNVLLGSSTDPVGFFTWGSANDLVTLSVKAQERAGDANNSVLAGDFLIPDGAYGGFSDNLEFSQDWSSYRGIRFWWYASQATNPASPTAGDDITVEIKDGGPDGEHSELWTTKFKDNWGSSTSRWKLVELPFSSFTLGGYQPGSTATKNGTLDLTSAWGFAPTFTPGKPTSTAWAIDDVQLYGTPRAAASASITTSQDVYLVDQGDTATVAVSVSTPSGDPLDADVSVDYSIGGGTALDTTDFEPVDGTLTFPVGTESGAAQEFDVSTISVDGASEAKTIPILLESRGAGLPETPSRVVINAHGLPYLDASLPTAERVADLLSRMSLEQKAGQMAQAERLGLESSSQIATLGLGSILSGGGSTPGANTPEEWATMIDGFQREALATPLQIPLVYGADAVHGHSNVLDATIFPHNTGLGATRDADLVEETALVTARETKSTGVNWAFAPCLCVTRDERWGRSYESFGEDPALVAAFAEANIVGLQGSDPTDKSGPDKVLATAKHWAGDGGTEYDASKAGSGYPIDQGLTRAASLDDFSRLFIDPYLPALEAGVGSIMPSYSGVAISDGPDIRMHEHAQLNTEVLKEKLGFSGFLISDWEGIDKLPGGTYAQKVARSVNSGMDMGMAPYNFGAFISGVVGGVENDAIAQSRVDDAVSRILTQKFEMGLFDDPFTDRSKQADFGSVEHRAVAREAVAKSQVLLKNDGVLPLPKDASVYLAGSNADDLGNQAGGWTISWQGNSGDTTEGTSIREGIEQVAPDAEVTFSKNASEPLAGHDIGVVVVGETPYAEGQGDVGNNARSLSLTTTDRSAIDTVCAAMKCVVLVVAGRTQLVTDKLDAIDGLVSSFLPGTEGAGVADVLFGDKPFTGRLPISWPATADQVPINVGDDDYEPLFAYGWGERTDEPRERVASVADDLPAGAARDAVNALLEADVWSAAGAVRNGEPALQLVARAAKALASTDRDTLARADLVVSVARDIAQAAVSDGSAAAGSSALTADAEHLLMSGDARGAVVKLAAVLGLSISEDETEPSPAPDPVPSPDPVVTPSAPPVPGVVLASTPAPVISGAARVGATLTANVRPWGPGSVALAFQWYGDGSAIAGATSPSLLLSGDRVGERVSVRVTGTASGFAPATVASSEVRVARGILPSAEAVVSGSVRAGGTVIAKHPGWSSSNGTEFTYRWYTKARAGSKAVAIKNATRPAYTVPASRKGEYLLVKITASRPGYAPRSVTSDASKVLGYLKAVKPTLAGTERVGRELRAITGTWSPSARFTFRWERVDGSSSTVIKGATSRSYTLKAADRGEKLRVLVTGKRAGYDDRTVASTMSSRIR